MGEMRVTKAHNWPDINTESMRSMRRGRDSQKPGDQKYSGYVAQAATKMPCGQEFHDRGRNESQSRAVESAKALVKTQAQHHLKKCAKCKSLK